MSYKRRLTVDGPRAAYDKLRQSQQSEHRDFGSRVSETCNGYVIRLDSNCDTNSAEKRGRNHPSRQSFRAWDHVG